MEDEAWRSVDIIKNKQGEPHVLQQKVNAYTAGVTEEVPYRGYTVERVTALTGSPLLAAAVSLVAFLAAHVGEHWSKAAAVQMAQPTVVLLALYLWTHSLPVVMAAHAINDAVGLLLAGRAAGD